MSNTNNKIDAYLKEQRKKQVPLIIGVIIACIIILLTFAQPHEKGKEVKGTVQRLLGVPTEDGQVLQLIVKLDNGEIIRSSISSSKYYKEGSVVILLKQKPIIVGRTRYVFMGYE